MYVRRTSAAKATNDSGTSIQGRNAAASCKPIYTVIHLRCTICVSKEAMERLPLSNPEGSLMACPQPYRSLMMPAQHFEPGDFTFRNRFGRAASQEEGRGEEREARSNEPIIDHTKQSWYFSNASSALTPDAEPNRSKEKMNSILQDTVYCFSKQKNTTHLAAIDIQSILNLHDIRYSEYFYRFGQIQSGFLVKHYFMSVD
ncbi:Hypothetical_protein [Hexamita inflata]|uniref:Hypothetical_protein n=1 Tax=Hexamita inflata TaxID=28002 RepID=A0AA86NVK6_9EUKA|nr:Hypothetical protein HINF_LOCUS13535 [Hexamita inflata]